MTAEPLAVRQPPGLRPDPSKVIAKLFVPGRSAVRGDGGQVDRIIDEVLALSDGEVGRLVDEVTARFVDRHRDIADILSHSADRITPRLDPHEVLSGDRRLLLGAAFTHEYSVEAAALCNPSAVADPDQSGVPDGALRFVMSVRQIGEGHRSSIGFRRGVIHGDGTLALDPPAPYTTAGTVQAGTLHADDFRETGGHLDDDRETCRWVLSRLGTAFRREDLEAVLARLVDQTDTRNHVDEVVHRFHTTADRVYSVGFPHDSTVGERVLYPAASVEGNGMEDARFVRFVEADGAVRYLATYTAFDGRSIEQQLLETTDFATFSVSPLHGSAAANKGLALFPRRIGGRFAALSRHDGMSLSFAESDDMRHWPSSSPLQTGVAPWSMIQVGNCGPPIETDEGWLVLTHGVGPMRTYSMGACLLDLDDPTVVLGQLDGPLLAPEPSEQDGYVPNVVYSCGGVRHGDVLLIPFGIADARIGFASVSVARLLGAMRAPDRR